MSSVEPEQYANQRDAGKESVGELIVSGRDGAVLLEFAEEALDEIALAVQCEVGLARLAAIGLRRDDRCYATLLKRLDQRVAVVAFVGQERVGLDPIIDLIEQRNGLIDIGGLAGRERQRHGIAKRVDYGVDLGRQPAARSADGLIGAVFF